MDVGEVAVAEDAGVWVCFLQATEQAQQSTFLGFGAGVGGMTVLVKAALVANAERMLVIAFGVGTNQILVARLIGRAVAGDVVVIARESEAVLMAADEGGHGKRTVTVCRTTMNDDEMDGSHGSCLYYTPAIHDVVVIVVTMAVSTVMMNWMMVFQVFMSLKIFI